MKVELLEALNSDGGICDAARVSFGKRACNFSDDQNRKLLQYLFKHKHWSPFGHAREMFDLTMSQSEVFHFLLSANLAGFTYRFYEIRGLGILTLNGSLWAWHENLVYLPRPLRHYIAAQLMQRYPAAGPLLFAEYFDASADDPAAEACVRRLSPIGTPIEESVLFYTSFRIKAPVFVARQLVKHQVQLCWNEVSRRYVDEPPELHDVKVWRRRPEASVKQGSGENLTGPAAVYAEELYTRFSAKALDAYDELLKVLHVAPEQARMVLPLSMETEWIWTGSLKAFARVCAERLAPNAQQETREIVEGMNELLIQNFPQRWAAAYPVQDTDEV